MSWWRGAVFYQVYPRSFLDADGDGIGDLEGVRQKLDYIAALGVDAIWLTPIYPSPAKDFGYDVSDYCSIDPRWGTLQDFDRFLLETHDRHLRVILDWVPNHSSSEHPWFVNARSSRNSALRDFYIWRDPGPHGELPNNWLRSWSDDPAWTLEPTTGQLYLHCFLPEQPDLNWANPRLRAEMIETLRFWMRRGVDGFRMDVINLIGKAPDLPDDPPELYKIGHVPLNDRPETHEYLKEIRAAIDAFGPDKMSVGESGLYDPERVAEYYGDDDELHLSFSFLSLLTPWRASSWAELIDRTEKSFGEWEAWPTWVLSNHDNMRVASRLREDPRRVRSAMLLLLSLRGTPFLYAGEELGLPDALIPPERVVDPGKRDGCRAPIPWDRSELHGWSAEPWLPFVDRASELSVESQEADPASMLAVTRRLLTLRRATPALATGETKSISVEDDVLRVVRAEGATDVEVVVNFARDARSVAMGDATLLYVVGDDATVTGSTLVLQGGAGALLAHP